MDGGGGKLLERSACWPMRGGMVDWRSDDGAGAWFLSLTEEVAESDISWSWALLVVKGALVMAFEMALRLWTMLSAGVMVRMER